MGYPFFLSSLPAIHVGTTPTWPLQRFLDEAARNLSAPDFATLQALLSGSPSQHPFVCQWRDFDTQLRNACARIRATQHGQDPAPFLRAHTAINGSLDRRVQALFQSAADPLARELALHSLRLEFLSSLPTDPFSLEAILTYALRLQIAASVADVNPEAGHARLRTFTDSIPLASSTPTLTHG